MNPTTTDHLTSTWDDILKSYEGLHELYGSIFLMCISSLPIFLAMSTIFGLPDHIHALRICFITALIMLACSIISAIRFRQKFSTRLLQEKATPKEMSRLRDANAKHEVEITRLNMTISKSQTATN